MKVTKVFFSVVRVVAYAALALVLLTTGLIVTLYSPWAQNLAREAVVDMMSKGDTRLTIDDFSLRFPLRLSASGLAMTTGGDTLMAAGAFRADVALLPLLSGEASIREAVAADARYRMGAPDSATFMTMAVDSLALTDASVRLADMAINVDRGLIRGGRMGLYINPDTSAPTPPAPPTKMSIALGHIDLDDFTYAMRLMPSIDTLSAHIGRASLATGNIDLFNQQIKLGQFTGSGLDARYIAPDSAAIAAAGPYPEATSETAADTITSAPWTVEIDSIGFSGSHALYATAGVKPLPGLDFTYIEVDDLSLGISNFYNQATTVQLPLKISGRERCGVALSIEGQLDITSEALTFKPSSLTTAEGTDVVFNGLMGMGDMAADPTLPLKLNLDGDFAPSDLAMMFPAFSPYLAGVPSATDIHLNTAVAGTTGHLGIDRLELSLNRCVSLLADGYIENFMNPDNLAGDINLKGNIINVDGFKNALLDRATAKTLKIPPMTLAGRVKMHSGIIDGRLAAATKGGRIKMDARWNSRREDYLATVATTSFPVQAFMPSLGVGPVTALVKADGHGYNPFAKSTAIDATARIASAEYTGVVYTDIDATAKLADGQATIDLNSGNPDLDLSLHASGNLDGDSYAWTADIDGRYIDLYALKFAAAPSSVEISAKADATIGPGKNDIKAHLILNDLFFRQMSGTIALSDIDAHLNGNDSLTALDLTNRDLKANFSAPVGLDSLMAGFTRASDIMTGEIASYMIDVDTLSRALPPFALDVRAGSDNLINDILAPSKMSLRSLSLSADHDSLLYLDAAVRKFDTGSMRLDSVFATARQHGAHLHLGAGVLNKPGNLDEWHRVNLDARAEGNMLAMRIKQENLKGKTGFDIGMEATASVADSTLTLAIKPTDPTIGYQQWNVNADNFISYIIPTQHIDANLHMQGGNSSLAIYTEHPGGNDHHDHSTDANQEDLVVKLSDIHISDWISFNPFAPPMKGDINADMRINRTDGILTGKGSAGITNFTYGREKVADFKADFDVAATPSGSIHANADLMVNGVRTMTLSGALNDSTLTSPLALDFSVIHFPLATANPFLPSTVGKLQGMLNGSLKISGTQEKPIFNGTLDFDSTAVRLALTGTPYTFSNVEIPVENNVVRFNDFAIKACNDNPLTVNGTVDITDMANMRMNLGLKADNMQIVNSRRAAKGADVYGSAFVSLDANVHGSMSLLNVNADVTVNSATNVTYVIPDATNTLSNRSTDDMVKFVNFTDSAAVAMADSLTNNGMAMFLDAVLKIEDGSIINVDLSADGKNKAQIQSNGTLTYSLSPLDTDGRLSGRLNIDKGFVRYTPPLMSEKYFTFDDGSYVAFTGDMMNPTLNVHATDVLKANVTQSGQNSRLVNFNVLLGVTGTLNRMDVKFDLSTNDDLTVANELESMSPEQRANQAMNLLLYNVYTGPGTKGNASLSGNPLFSFLESQVNSWMANNIKGVDITLGVDQYDRTVNGNTSTTMSYSYQVSKSLFNDRFKIVVGGNYSTDANADENFSQNLINDISFEYFLNQGRTMYVRLFRHTGYESILEGEVTQTGVGFVYRRKLRHLVDMFLPTKKLKEKEAKE